MTKYHNIEEETTANLNEWHTSISNVVNFEQFSATLPYSLSGNPLKLIYHNNQYILFSKSSFCFVSTDLTNWERKTHPIINLSNVFILNNFIYMVNSSQFFRSNILTSGSRYESSDIANYYHYLPMQNSTENVIAIGNSIKYAGIWNLTYTTKLEVSLTQTNEFRTETGATTDIVWAGDRYFFANQHSPYCYYSFDGTNWLEVRLPFPVDNGVDVNLGVAGTTGKYYITGANSGHIYYTPDFISWIQVNVAGSHYDYRPIMFYHETMKEIVGIHGQKDLWFQEDIPTKFTIIGPPRDLETSTYSWVDIFHNGEKYIAWIAQSNRQNVYFATISDSYKDTNLSYVLSMILQKMDSLLDKTDETNTKLQSLIDLQQ